MKEEEVFFIDIGNEIKEAVKSQMFGKPCFKIEKKAFTCYFKNAMDLNLQVDSIKKH